MLGIIFFPTQIDPRGPRTVSLGEEESEALCCHDMSTFLIGSISLGPVSKQEESLLFSLCHFPMKDLSESKQNLFVGEWFGVEHQTGLFVRVMSIRTVQPKSIRLGQWVVTVGFTSYTFFDLGGVFMKLSIVWLNCASTSSAMVMTSGNS